MSSRSTFSHTALWLLLGAAFFIPWGEGLQIPWLPVPPNKLFLGFCVPMLALWLGERGFRLTHFQKEYRWFIYFVMAHTVAACMAMPGVLLDFEYQDSIVLANGIVKNIESPGFSMLRGMFFLLISIGVAQTILTPNNISWVALAITTGLLAVNFFHGYSIESTVGVYHAQSYLNPNSFGRLSAITFFLALFLWFSPNTQVIKRFVGLCGLGLALGCVILTGSRGSVTSVAVGLLAMSLSIKSLSRRIWMILLILIVFSAVVVIVDQAAFEMLRLRFSLLPEDQGSKRIETWGVFFGNLHRFWFLGTGAGRSETVTSEALIGSGSPHNTYLNVWVQFGIIGLYLFLNALRSLVRSLYHNMRGSHSMRDSTILGLLTCCLTCFLVMDCLDARDVALALGIIVAYAHLRGDKLRENGTSSSINLSGHKANGNPVESD